jgi:hypothetical protein
MERAGTIVMMLRSPAFSDEDLGALLGIARETGLYIPREGGSEGHPIALLIESIILERVRSRRAGTIA